MHFHFFKQQQHSKDAFIDRYEKEHLVLGLQASKLKYRNNSNAGHSDPRHFEKPGSGTRVPQNWVGWNSRMEC